MGEQDINTMAESISVVVAGSKGKMGAEVVNAVTADSEMRVAGEVDAGDSLEETLRGARPDVLVDFTHPDVALGNIETALKNGVVPIVGTSGLGPVEIAQIEAWCAQYR